MRKEVRGEHPQETDYAHLWVFWGHGEVALAAGTDGEVFTDDYAWVFSDEKQRWRCRDGLLADTGSICLTEGLSGRNISRGCKTLLEVSATFVQAVLTPGQGTAVSRLKGTMSRRSILGRQT